MMDPVRRNLLATGAAVTQLKEAQSLLLPIAAPDLAVSTYPGTAYRCIRPPPRAALVLLTVSLDGYHGVAIRH